MTPSNKFTLKRILFFILYYSYISNVNSHHQVRYINYSKIYLSLYIWFYSPLLDLGRFFSFLIYTQSVGLLGGGISQSQGRYIHTEQHKHRINAHGYPWFDLDSNPRSLCSRQQDSSCLRPRDDCDRHSEI
jgi:hypothetical protein